MAVKRHILALWILAALAVAGYGIASYILPQTPDNTENIKAALVPVTATVLPDMTPGSSLPLVKFLNGKGDNTTLADFKGEVVLVNLWATWCTPCVAELPLLDSLQRKMKGRKFRVVAISLDFNKRPSYVRNFLEKKWIYLEPYWDKFRQIPEKWRYEGIPTSYLIDADGRLIETFPGPQEWDAGEVYERISAAVK